MKFSKNSEILEKNVNILKILKFSKKNVKFSKI